MQEEGTKAILKHNPIVSSFMTCHWVGNKSNATGVNRGVRTIYATGTLKFTHVIIGVRVGHCVDFCVFADLCLCFFYRPYYYVFFFDLWIPKYPFGIFNNSCTFFLTGSEVLHPIFSIFIKLASGISQKEEPPVGIEQHLHIFHSRKIISGYS